MFSTSELKDAIHSLKVTLANSEESVHFAPIPSVLKAFWIDNDFRIQAFCVLAEKTARKLLRGESTEEIDSFWVNHLGFKEDFGTGSAHSSLYPFLKDRLDFSKKIHFYQESQRKSMGLISKLKEDNHIVIETDVSEYSVKALEID